MMTNKNYFKRHLPAVLIISFMAAVFLIITLLFHTRFYPGTMINEVDVSLLTGEEADKRLSDRAASYALVLYERDGMTERIHGSEIGLGVNDSFKSSRLKRRQNNTFWVFSMITGDGRKFGNAFTYDEELLRKRFRELGCLDPSRIVEPKNATLVYSNGAYRVVNEVYGNKVNEGRLFFGIKNAVRNGRPELDLEKRNIYIDPAIISESDKLLNTKATAEKYLESKIVYTGGSNGSVTVDAGRIAQWIGFDDNLNITFDRKKITDFLKALAINYDTVGTERSFVTTSGRTISVGGGDYGWKVDVKKETENLVEDIMSGRTVLKEPAYSQKGVLPGLNDIGSTYVEIDLTNQYLWCYVAGERIAGGAVVTGDMDDGYQTPEGIYSLKYKVRNAVLKGTNYRAQVSYWMPFNGDIGIHDASWRTDFGRDIYLARGSHGCINVEYRLAEKLYNNISVGTPIICYY